MTRTSKSLTGLALVTALSACGDATDVSTDARVRVLLTDAPIDYVAAASVDIGAVELIPGDGAAPIVLTDDGTDGFVNLLDLRGEVTLMLADATIEAGTYRQIRLIVEAATVTLIDGYEFDGGGNEMDLFVPSGAQTGIKLNLGVLAGEEGEGGLVIGDDATLVLDFDVSRSFVMQGNPETPAGIKGMLFTPTLRVTSAIDAGSIAGAVTAPAGVSVEGLTVSADLLNEEGEVEEGQTTTATTLTAADGTYQIFFLPPGSYRVTLTPPEGFTSTPASADVDVADGEDVTGVDFALAAS